ncbi:protein kinase [Myxococcus llanfairpwllgwyngyllgogerychwyrndrobwllllantysiliogogogochensis]|uniref:Protein kinase n=1 Tax=Myxococcus llanfairpwllgwyngyllgogerychwyrndrobwllllantysiliogogogochensis TaxID=2590453 RepID=A0A540WL06_9BACT|nr:serine/threonine-protein kinase [Myxococcus llanfairpwllgwyngyllgogerychwyrndrobwllllantysiliogogogochensis]TQF09691.1 protein kinase [Myxococcus llanfairpwllgwyngyllgogerychwyrndrobwllllantysiliogogogochensis]
MAVPFGKYELLRKIASGGMGQVFLAREHGTGFERLVVLKLILPHLAEDDEFLSMFLDEAGLVARLTHPNLITILDLSQIEGRHCLAMEYVQGDDVRRLEKFSRAQNKPMSVGLILRVIADAAAGLHYAHQARDVQGRPMRLVHRDVSPQNILVGFDGGVKVIDFGVAKAATSSANTATGVLKGKYPYMSPEQASGLAIDARSDLFALGVVMWEMLTGKRLFKGDSDLMTLRLVKDCQVPRPSQLNPKLPPGLDEVVLKALAPTPDERYPDCGAFRLALEDYTLNLRLPSSSAHLSAYLRELYADRISTETDPAKLDQLAEDADLDSRSNSSLSGVGGPGGRTSASRQQPRNVTPGTRSRQQLAAAVGGPVVQDRTRGTAPMERAPSAEVRRIPWVPVVAAGAGLLVAAAAVIFLRGPAGAATLPEKPPTQTQQVHVERERPPPTPTPEPVKMVELPVITEPPGATVSIAGEERGVTPMKLELEQGAPMVAVTLALNGYEPVTREVSAADDELRLELRRQGGKSPGSTSTKRPGNSQQGGNLGIKTGR